MIKILFYISLILITLGLILLGQINADSKELEVIEYSDTTDINLMYGHRFDTNERDRMAIKYEMSPTIERLAYCESRMNPSAVNKNDIHYNLDGTISVGSYGLLQFSKPTFYKYSRKVGIEEPDIMNPEHQILTAEHMLDKNLHRRWSCWEIISN